MGNLGISKLFIHVGFFKTGHTFLQNIDDSFAKSNRNTEMLIERDLSELSWVIEK